jgi:hypothetical protein
MTPPYRGKHRRTADEEPRLSEASVGDSVATTPTEESAETDREDAPSEE